MTTRRSKGARRGIMSLAVLAGVVAGPGSTSPVGAAGGIEHRPVRRTASFEHVGSFDVVENLRPGEPISTPTLVTDNDGVDENFARRCSSSSSGSDRPVAGAHVSAGSRLGPGAAATGDPPFAPP